MAGRDDLPKLQVRHLRSGESRFTAGLAARAMRDNPTTEAMFGPESLERLAQMQLIWTAFFHRPPGTALGAFYKGVLVGLACATPPGGCIGFAYGPHAARVANAPEPLLGDPARADYVRATYAVHDLPDRHWHVGPVAVEPRFQGRGIGHALMRELIAVMDAEGSASWAETDTEPNVRFYKALGWDVAKTIQVVGIPLWFIHRAGPGAG